jgi:hypothetical protein
MAITTYQEIIGWIGDGDPTIRRLIEEEPRTKRNTPTDLKDLLGIDGVPCAPGTFAASSGRRRVVVQQAFTARSAWQAELDAGSCCCRCGFPKADPT